MIYILIICLIALVLILKVIYNNKKCLEINNEVVKPNEKNAVKDVLINDRTEVCYFVNNKSNRFTRKKVAAFSLKDGDFVTDMFNVGVFKNYTKYTSEVNFHIFMNLDTKEICLNHKSNDNYLWVCDKVDIWRFYGNLQYYENTWDNRHKKLIPRLNRDQIVHCKTKEEVKSVFEYAAMLGYEWNSGRSFTDKTMNDYDEIYIDLRGGGICYNLDNKIIVTATYFINNGY